MIRGTTPTHEFKVPFNKDMIKTVKIIYCQNDKTIFCKNTEDCTIEDGIISVTLTQEDTFACKLGAFVDIQVRILTDRDEALSSNIMHDTVYKSLDDEVLV